MPRDGDNQIRWNPPTSGLLPAHSTRTGGDIVDQLAGRDVLYRLAYTSNAVIGQPENVRVHGVDFTFTQGPIETMRVEMQQRIPPPLVWDKCMKSGVKVGEGRYVTLCTLEAQVQPNEPMWIQVRGWRDHVMSAAGLLVATLDERFFGEEILEDVLVHSEEGTVVANRVAWVRDYLPRAIGKHELETLGIIQDPVGDPIATTAARWYLKAARAGPTADAIVAFWIALEALGGVDRSNVRRVVELMEDAGLDLTESGLPDIGRLYGLRSAIVHDGVEVHPLIEEGFTVLEAAVRAILRKRVGTELWRFWPVFNAAPNVELPPEGLAWLRHAYENPIEEWHEGALPTPPPPPDFPTATS